MKRILALTLVAALSLSLVACASKELEEEPGEDVGIVEEHAKISDVKVTSEDDKTIVISLDGNPTTGYTWKPINYDETLINIEENYNDERTEEGFAGAGGTFNFKITGLREGKTLVDFTYLREWEGQASAIENHPVEVQVSEDLNVTVPVDMI